MDAPPNLSTVVIAGRNEHDPISYRAGRLAYEHSIDRGQPMSPEALAAMFGFSITWAKARMVEVHDERRIQKTATAEHDPADVTWLDNVDLQASPPTPEMLIELAGGIVDALAVLAHGLQQRETPVPVDVLEQLVFHLGGRGGVELKKVFDRLGLDLAGWVALNPGRADEAGVVSGTLQNALVWTGEHSTPFDLDIRDEHPLEVRACILSWLGPWFVDFCDDFTGLAERATDAAGLLRILKHAPAPPPVVDEDAGEQS